MTHTATSADLTDTVLLHSRNQLLEQLHSEQQEAKAITQPILDTEAGFIKNLEHYMTHRDTLCLRKRELLHKRWTESVWLPVQQSIEKHFAQHGYNETKKMRSMHMHYINYCNAKGFVFLESYDPLEYNPFLLQFNRSKYHKVSTPVLEDPLSLRSRARIKEKTAILYCQTGHVYRRQQVEDLLQRLQSSPVSHHSVKQSRVKPFSDTASEKLLMDRNLWGSRNRGTPYLATAEGRCFQPECWSSHGHVTTS